MTSSKTHSIFASAFLAAVVFAATSMFGQTPQFITFDAPDAGTISNSGTIPRFINSKGVIAGDYTDNDGAYHNFIRDTNGVITDFDPPVAVPHVNGINSRGDILGSGVVAGGFNSYLRTFSGQFFHIHVPGSSSTSASAINDLGQISGSYVNAGSVGHAFIRSVDGTYTFFDDPSASPGGTVPLALNNDGAVAGYFVDNNTGAIRCFVRDPFGNFTNFDPAPGVTSVDSVAINSNGEISGRYLLSSFPSSFGFVRDASGNVTDFSVPNGVGQTFPSAINDAGVIVGNWYDSNEVSHGFTRNAAGNVTVFSVPVTRNDTYPFSINNTGRITGYYRDNNFRYRGFVR